MRRDVLIYGFGPYDSFADNVTTDIVKEIARAKLARSHVFDVRFSRRMFEDMFKKYQPRIIIGLGQHPRARKIRVERKAINWKASRAKVGCPIVLSGPQYRFANFTFPKVAYSTVTYDAGTYVCNYSMYVAAEYAEKHGATHGFLHVPLEIVPRQVLGYLRKALQ